MITFGDGAYDTIMRTLDSYTGYLVEIKTVARQFDCFIREVTGEIRVEHVNGDSNPTGWFEWLRLIDVQGVHVY